MLSNSRHIFLRPLASCMTSKMMFSASANAAEAVANTAEAVASSAEAAVVPPRRVKHRIPQKRASKLLNELRIEEFEKLKNGREYPRIRAGDSIQIEKLPYMTAKETEIIKGVVIAKTNRRSESQMIVANVEYGTPLQRRIHLFDPLIKDVKILQHAFIHKGLKRVRRSKIYYLLERNPECFTVK
eukprot:gene6047-6660_t